MTPNPNNILSGTGYLRYRQPCVYGWYRNRTYLYIGSSEFGLSRVLNQEHHIVNTIEPVQSTDVFHFWHSSNIRALELELIRRHQPLYNQAGKPFAFRLKYIKSNLDIAAEVLTKVRQPPSVGDHSFICFSCGLPFETLRDEEVVFCSTCLRRKSSPPVSSND